MDWKSFLLGEEDWSFLGETVLRTFVMFLVILLSLRVLGKRSISQLSVFELGVVIGLGSAAGDPMFYKDVGLLPCIIVFVMVVSLYRLLTFLINRSIKVEHFVEGRPVCIIDEGRFLPEEFKNEPIAHDELFAQLRHNSVAHLGQVQQAIIESNGQISLFYYPDEEVRYGLPIIPKLSDIKHKAVTEEGHYACESCSNTEKLAPAPRHQCPVCGCDTWIRAINNRRIA